MAHRVAFNVIQHSVVHDHLGQVSLERVIEVPVAGPSCTDPRSLVLESQQGIIRAAARRRRQNAVLVEQGRTVRIQGVASERTHCKSARDTVIGPDVVAAVVANGCLGPKGQRPVVAVGPFADLQEAVFVLVRAIRHNEHGHGRVPDKPERVAALQVVHRCVETESRLAPDGRRPVRRLRRHRQLLHVVAVPGQILPGGDGLAMDAAGNAPRVQPKRETVGRENVRKGGKNSRQRVVVLYVLEAVTRNGAQ